MKNTVAIGVVFTVVFIGGCATPGARLHDVAQVELGKEVGFLYIGPFYDFRKGGNVDTSILGTKRGGFGNPLGRVRHEKGAGDFVQENLVNTLKDLKYYVEKIPGDVALQPSGNGNWIISNSTNLNGSWPILVGSINNLLVETGFTRGTVVEIDVWLIDSKRGGIIWAAKLAGKESEGVGSGIFEDTDRLKDWLAKTVQDQATVVFSSPGFRQAIEKCNKQ